MRVLSAGPAIPMATATIADDGVLTGLPRGAHPGEGASKERESRDTALSPELRGGRPDIAFTVKVQSTVRSNSRLRRGRELARADTTVQGGALDRRATGG
jgi:hypothetical protein